MKMSFSILIIITFLMSCLSLVGFADGETISISAPSVAPVGSKVNVTVTTDVSDGMQIVYNVNGRELPATTDKNMVIDVQRDKNVVFAKVVKNGSVVATSQSVVVEGLQSDFSSFKNYEYDSFGNLQCIKHPNLEEDAISLHEIVNYDGIHGNVAKLTIANSGLTTQLYPEYSDRKWFAGSKADYISLSYDILVKEYHSGHIGVSFNYFNANKEAYPRIFDFNCGGSLSVGYPNSQKISYEKNKWYNLQIFIDRNSETISYLVDNVVYSVASFDELGASKEYDFDAAMTKGAFLILGIGNPGVPKNENDIFSNIIYADNHTLSYGTYSVATVHLSATKSVLPGHKVVVSTETISDNLKFNYYHNGVLCESNSSNQTSYVTAVAGKNEVYAEVLDSNGDIIETTQKLIFTSYPDVPVAVLSQSVSTTNYPLHATLRKGTNIYENDETTFASDPSHETVLKLGSTVDEETTEDPRINILSDDRKPFFAYTNGLKRLMIQSIEIYPENITEKSIHFRCSARNVNYNEVIMTFFKVDANNIYVASNIGMSEYLKIPYTKKWYNLSVVIDPIEGVYLLLVDNVIYSMIDALGTKYAPAQYDGQYGGTFLYYDIVLYGSSDATNPNMVYLDNYKVEYTDLPEIHTPFVYINNAKFIQRRSELSASDSLSVDFIVTKCLTNNILCVATAIDGKGKLFSVATRDAVFDDTTDTVDVSLNLENLPSDIATGDYTVNVMLLDADTMRPIVAKTILPD